MNILQSGPSSIVIFRTDANINDWPVVYNYGKTKGTQQIAMPKRFIIDAVEILKYKATGVETANKRFYNDLDAGYQLGLLFAIFPSPSDKNALVYWLLYRLSTSFSTF